MPPDAELLRTFVAVEVDEAARERAGQIGERLRAVGGTAFKWVDPRCFHLTLKFLGPTRREDLPRLAQALGEMATRHATFEMELAGVGVFPGLQRPQVVWLGVREGREALAALAGDAEAACASLGWAREDRPYQAHLTLARTRPPRRGARSFPAGGDRSGKDERLATLTRAIAAESEASAGRVLVTRTVLMQSDLSPQGPTYTVLESFPLGQSSGQWPVASGQWPDKQPSSTDH